MTVRLRHRGTGAEMRVDDAGAAFWTERGYQLIDEGYDAPALQPAKRTAKKAPAKRQAKKSAAKPRAVTRRSVKSDD